MTRNGATQSHEEDPVPAMTNAVLAAVKDATVSDSLEALCLVLCGVIVSTAREHGGGIEMAQHAADLITRNVIEELHQTYVGASPDPGARCKQ